MKIIPPVLLLIAFVTAADAQTRCECEYDDWVDDCDAEFERKDDWIVFKSDTRQCSRIDWYTDSQPRLTIVEDGTKTQHLMNIPSDAEISIASCKVCKDRNYQASKPTTLVEERSSVQDSIAGSWFYPNSTAPNRLELQISNHGDEVRAEHRDFYQGVNNSVDVFLGPVTGRYFTLEGQHNPGYENAVMHTTVKDSALTVRVLYDDGMFEQEPVDFRR